MTTEFKHIALIIGSMRMGGAEKASVNLLNEFAGRGIQCDLVLVHNEGELLGELHKNIRVFPLGKSRTIFSGPALCRYFKDIKPQVIIAAQTHVQLLCLWSRNKVAKHIPVILNEHSNFSTNQPPGFFKRNFIRRLANTLFPSAQAITAVSKGVAEDLSKEFPGLSSKISILHNAVVTKELISKSNEPVQLPWNEVPSIPVILGAGRLVYDKDFNVLIEAVAIVRKQKRIRLVILGDGEEYKKIRTLANNLNFGEDILLNGYTKNPFSWMRISGLFVLSSRREGLPMVLIEAMACGCKVISTDCPSGPKEILQNGKFGKLIPVGDVQAMAKAIKDELESGQKPDSMDIAIKPFLAEVAADKYLTLMKNLATGIEK